MHDHVYGPTHNTEVDPRYAEQRYCTRDIFVSHELSLRRRAEIFLSPLCVLGHMLMYAIHGFNN